MDKLVATILLVTACIAATSAVQGFAPQAVNWANVSVTISEMEALMKANLEQVRAVATNDNEQVGLNIGIKLDATLVNVTAIIEEMSGASTNQTMTEGIAQDFVGQLMGTTGRLFGSLREDLDMLTTGAAVHIRIILGGTFDSMELRAERIYTLLRRGSLICYYNLDPVNES